MTNAASARKASYQIIWSKLRMPPLLPYTSVQLEKQVYVQYTLPSFVLLGCIDLQSFVYIPIYPTRF